jgi:hypothetical protein
MQKRLASVLNPFLEDEALTDGLTDAEAKILLDWVQAQLARLLVEAQTLEAEAAQRFIQPRLKRLRARVRQIAQTSVRADDPTASLRTLLPRAAFHFASAKAPAQAGRRASPARQKTSRG